MTLNGGGGIDTITGTNQADTLQGNAGGDTITALDGNDHIAAKDNEADRIDCGIGTDTVDGDTKDIFGACEDLTLGVLRLTPKTLSARAGEPIRLRLSWRHPRAWKQLRTIELRLTHDDAPVGQVTIRPAPAGSVRTAQSSWCAPGSAGRARPSARAWRCASTRAWPAARCGPRSRPPTGTDAGRSSATPRASASPRDPRPPIVPGGRPTGRSPRPHENRNRQRGRP